MTESASEQFLSFLESGRTSPVECTKSKAPSAFLFPIFDRDCLCQCNRRGFPCLFQGGRRDQSSGSSTFSPSQPKLVGHGPGSWRIFWRTFSPGTGAVAIKLIVTHLQRSSHHCDPTLQSTCTSWQSCWQTCKLCLFRALFPASFLCCIFLLKATPDLEQCNLDRVT